MLLKKMFRTAWKYKAQFISMIIMIAIGIGVFLGFNIEWKSLETDAFAFLSETNYADFRLYSESGFSAENAEAVSNIDGVKAATRYLSVNVGVKSGKKTVTLNVSENYTVSTMLVTDGEEYDENSDGIWLSDRFAEENSIKLGDEITFVYKGAEITGKIAGLCKSGENAICVADSNQLMPDYKTHGFAYISPRKYESAAGAAFYPQINLTSDMEKSTLEEAVKAATGTTIKVVDKSLHTAYAGVKSESEEGKTMGAVLPVLFLAIAVLTMVTTMHRIAVNEKVQIGTLKALGFRDGRILRHYTSYGLFIGVVGCVLGVALGYGVAALIISPRGMMSTYLDLPDWSLVMPAFSIPVIVCTAAFLTLISFLSVKKMLKGTAADALRPYTPKTIKKSAAEKIPLLSKSSFFVKWNLRDILRHKSRSAMTLLGVFGCMLLIVGGLGMNDTMQKFINTIGDDVSNYATKVIISETAPQDEVFALADSLDGDYSATTGVSYGGDTVTLEIYRADEDKIRFINEGGDVVKLGSDGVYLCLRLKDTAKIGDTVEFSPYGSDVTYTVKVAGYIRSLVSECIAMTAEYADEIGLGYRITAVYTDAEAGDVAASHYISGKQEKSAVMESYDTFLQLMNFMIVILIIAAIILGAVVLYNLGVMSYLERKRELATLKVLGFRDKTIAKLLISQNVFLTLLGVLIGLPGGVGVLYVLIKALCSEYELQLTVSALTCVVSILLTFGVSLLVGVVVARKQRKIDMVEALKFAE